MPVKKSLEEAVKAYQNLYPNFKFPNDFPEPKRLKILIQSKGRKILFTKCNGEYKVFFEDDNTNIQNIPDWDKLIGCGG